uniref:Uncharacterized protein n=1 Tax=Glossina pallidipes TaxID=7398 RepID=A0A1B0A8Y0_GLOPL
MNIINEMKERFTYRISCHCNNSDSSKPEIDDDFVGDMVAGVAVVEAGVVDAGVVEMDEVVEFVVVFPDEDDVHEVEEEKTDDGDSFKSTEVTTIGSVLVLIDSSCALPLRTNIGVLITDDVVDAEFEFELDLEDESELFAVLHAFSNSSFIMMAAVAAVIMGNGSTFGLYCFDGDD